MKELSDEKRIIYLRKIVSFFFVTGILCPFKLWITNRSFPLLPVIDVFHFPAFPLDHIILFFLIIALSISFFHWKIQFNLIIIFLLLLLFIQDQNRSQPWVIIYFLFIVFLSSAKKSATGRNNVLICLRLLMIGIYFWAGIQKLNIGFIDATFHSILNTLFRIKDESLIMHLRFLGYIIPLTEICISIMLFIPKYRNKGFFLVVLSHLLC